MIKPRSLTWTGAAPALLATAAGVAAAAGIAAIALYSSQENGEVKKGEISRSAPGPEIGVGLPALVVVGGYVWYRNRFRKSKT